MSSDTRTKVEYLSKALEAFEERGRRYPHVPNIVGFLRKANEIDLAIEALRIGYFDVIRLIEEETDREKQLNLFGHWPAHMAMAYAKINENITPETTELHDIGNELNRLRGLYLEVLGDYGRAADWYAASNMPAEASQMEQKAKEPDPSSPHPNEQDWKKWQQALREFQDRPSVKAFRQEEQRNMLQGDVVSRIKALMEKLTN